MKNNEKNSNNGTNVREDIIAVVDGTAAGAMVWWTLVDNVDEARLRSAWVAEGLDESWVPATPLPQVALGRACRQFSKQRRLVRPLEGRHGYSIVAEDAAGTTLSYEQQLNVTVNPIGMAVCEPSYHALAPSVEDAYLKTLMCLDADDISQMLRKFCASLLAVSLRDTGGFYFIPPSQTWKFQAAGRALRAASGCQLWKIPAMKSEGAVDAVINAVEVEALTITRELEGVLDTGEAGERALRTKIRECRSTEQKVAEYEALLGRKLDEVTKGLADLRSRLTEAALQAAQAAEEAQATRGQ